MIAMFFICLGLGLSLGESFLGLAAYLDQLLGSFKGRLGADQREVIAAALEAQVLNLKDKTEDTNRLRDELDETTKARGDLQEQLEKLSNRLEASEKSNNSLEKDLAGIQGTIGSLRGENEELREKLGNSDSRTADLRAELEQEQSINSDLLEAKTRLENETKSLSANYTAAKSEIEAFKKALRSIRSEVTRTSGRVRQRYQRDLEQPLVPNKK